jgi:hypothetical protein
MRAIRCFRPSTLLPLAALLALAACTTGNPVGPGGVTSVNAPTAPHVGDEWRYRVTSGYSKEERGVEEIKVVEAAGNRVIVETSGFRPGRWTLTPDLQWITHPLADDRVQTFSPAYPTLVFPLAAGQKWDIKVAGRDDSPDIAYRSVAGPTDGVTVQGWVTGWERITVPAGEFDVIKIRRVTWGGNFTYDYSQSEIVEDLWYAPSIGKVVRHDSRWQRLALYTRLRDGPLYIKGDWLIRELLPAPAPEKRAALVP